MNRLTYQKRDGNYSIRFDLGNLQRVDIKAMNKLGKLEDTFELIEEMYKKPVCWKSDDGKLNYDYYTHSTILYNPKTNEIEIYEYEFIASYKVEEYGLTWWLKEEEE